MSVVGQFDMDSECREREADMSHPLEVPQCEWEGGWSVWKVVEGEKRFPFCLLGLGTEMT